MLFLKTRAGNKKLYTCIHNMMTATNINLIKCYRTIIDMYILVYIYMGVCVFVCITTCLLYLQLQRRTWKYFIEPRADGKEEISTFRTYNNHNLFDYLTVLVTCLLLYGTLMFMGCPIATRYTTMQVCHIPRVRA